MARRRTWISFVLVFVILFSMLGPLSISSVSADDPPPPETEQITLPDESTPEPVIEEPTPTPEPVVEEPAPTPEPVAEEPTPTPEPVAEEPTPTPEPTVEAPGAFTLASDDGTTIRVAYQDADTSALIPGACFQLHFDNGAGEVGDYIDAPCDEDDGTADGYTHFDHPLLSTGTYHIVQWGAPTNYPKINWHTFTVTEAGTLNTHVVFVHLGGKVRITFLEGGEPAPGFLAQIYAVASGGYPTGHVASIQDASDGSTDGVVTIDHLPAGDYLVEGVHPTFYLAPPLTPVTINPGQEATITIPVERGGVLKFSTTDADTGDPLLGACYYLRDSEGETVDHLCDENDDAVDGVTTFYKLLTGDYTWEQTLSAPNYIVASGGLVGITTGLETTIPVTNELGGSVVVTLEDEEGQPLGGGYFALEREVEGSRVEVMLACDTCDGYFDAVATFSGVPAGDYFVKHYSPSTGYQAAPEQAVVVTAGQATPITMTSAPAVPTAIRIEFRDQATGDLVPGACMELYHDDGAGGMGDYIGEWCDGYDDLDGVTLLSSIDIPFGAGSYVVRVGWSPSMYPRLQTQTVSVAENAQSELVFSILKGGRVTIQFREGDEPALNFGASVHTSTGEFIGNASDNEPWEVVDGEITIDNLPVGDLYVEAWHTGVYLHPPHFPFSISSGEDKTITIQVERGGVLKFETTDSESNPLLDACYYLRDSEGETVDHLCDGHDGAVDGVTTFYKLLTGDYTWEQTFSAPNYVPVSGSFPVTATVGEEQTIPVTNELGGSVVVTLRDGDTLEPLIGGYFSLQAEDGEGNRQEVGFGCDSCDGENDSVTTINGIVPGEYILVQPWAVDGYARAAEQPVTVVAGEATPITVEVLPFTPSTDPPVAVADEATTAPGQPITIYVLDNDYDPDTPHGELTVQLNESGWPSNGDVALSGDDFTAITYTPNPGFLGTDFFSYFVSDGTHSTAGYVTVYVLGDLTLEVVNVDELGAPAIGACYQLLAIIGETEEHLFSRCADDYYSGVVTFDGLVTGQYLLRITSGANGMVDPADRTVDVGPDTVTTVTIVHQLLPDYGVLVLHATGPDGSPPLPSTCWYLDMEEYGSYYGCDADDTVSDGTTRFFFLPAGEHTLRQVQSPSGYAAPADRPVTITGGQFTVLDIEHAPGDHLRIATQYEDGSPLTGVCASILTDEGTAPAAKCDDAPSDGATDGVIAFPVVPPGSYTALITSTGSPDVYASVTSFPFTVQGDGAVVTPDGSNTQIVTFLPAGGVSITFVDALGQPFNGYICISLFEDAGDGARGWQIPGLGSYVCPGMHSDPEGNLWLDPVVFGGLAPGQYLAGLGQGYGIAISPDASFTATAGTVTDLVVTVTAQTGALLVLDGSITGLNQQRLQSVTVGQTISLNYNVSNLGIVNAWDVRITGSHFAEYQIADSIGAGSSGFFRDFTYTVTEDDAELGYLTVTATLTADGFAPVVKVMTIPVASPVNTPAGYAQLVTPAGGTGVSLTFDEVTTPGFSVANPVASAPALPGGFRLDNALFFEITTTAVFDGQVLVCIPYDTGALTAPHLLHYDGGEWVDITSEADSSEGLVCGYTDHFSLFALAEPELSATPVTLVVENVDQYDFPVYACHHLYQQVGEVENLIDTRCMEEVERGRITFEQVVPGHYRLQLVEGWGGSYVLNDDVLFDVGDEPITTITVIFELAESFGALAIFSTGPDEVTPAVAACYMLFQDEEPYGYADGCDASDNSLDGWTRLQGIEPGVYTLQQYNTPPGHVTVADRTITITGGHYSAITIPHPSGESLRIEAERADGGSVSHFCATVRNEAQTATIAYSCDAQYGDGASDGVLTLPVLPPGVYKVQVSDVADEDIYLPRAESIFDVIVHGDGTVETPGGGNTHRVTYELAGSIHVDFVDNFGQPVGGEACFALYEDAGDGTRGLPVGFFGDYTCPDHVLFPGIGYRLGPLHLGGLAPGNYLVTYASGPGRTMADLPITVIAGETTSATATIVSAPTYAPVVDGVIASQAFQILDSATLGQTILIRYSVSNLGTSSIHDVVLSGSHFPDHAFDVIQAGSVNNGIIFPYTVTIADVLAGSLTVTATLTSNQTDPVVKVLTIPVTAPPNTPEDPTAPVVAAGGTGATLTFGDVSQAGFSAVIPLEEAPPLPDGFSLDGALFYEISTTAVFDGSVLVCIPYDTGQLTNPRLLHYVEGEGWIDITSEADSSEGLVCGYTDHFSPFALVQPLSSPSDTTAPVITVPGPIVVEATSQAGAVVTFPAPTATDDVDGSVPVTCSRSSGQTFAIGTTNVNCSATDAAGNTGAASFTVKVQTTKSPTNVNQCKNNGWKNFNNPFFSNQTQCTTYVAVHTVVSVVVIIFGIIITLLLG